MDTELIYYYKIDEDKQVYISSDKDLSSVFEIRSLISILNSYESVEEYIKDNYSNKYKIVHVRW